MEWYRIENAANRKAVMSVFGYIGDSWDSESVTARKFFSQLQELDVDDIELHINSQGGSLPDGNAIYNALRNHKARVHVVVDGMALSAASVVAMAGDVVEMPENAMMMIHDPNTYASGNAEDMRKIADVLDKWKVGIVAAYRLKTGLPEERITAMMSEETWMTAREAKLLGFADQVGGAALIEACVHEDAFHRFRHAPMEVMNVFVKKPENSKEGEKEMNITIELLRDKHPDLVTALLEEGRAAGAQAERERIQGVLAESIPGHEALVQDLAFDGRTSPADAARQILAAERKVRGSARDRLDRDAPPPVPHAEPGPDPAGAGSLPVELRTRQAWDRDPQLRAEFRTYEAYLAWERHTEAGDIRIYKK